MYTIVVTNTESGCSNEATVVIDTNADFPEIVFNTPLQINCIESISQITAGNSFGTGNLSFSWFDENQNLISEEDFIDVDNAGEYTLVLTDTDSDCTVEESISITDDLSEPLADAGPAQIITCDISSVQLTGGNSSSGTNFTYEWFNSNDVSLGTTVDISVENPGEYILVVTNAENGCTSISTVDVTPDENIPLVEIDNDGELSCLQAEVTLFSTLADNPNYSYSWENEDGEVLSTSTSYITNIPGVYTLIAIDGTNGCSNFVSIPVEENFVEPVLDSETPDLISCISSEVTLSAALDDPTQNVTYVWSSETQDNIGTEATITVDAPGTYNVFATNLSSGCTATLDITVNSDFEIATPDAEVSNIIDCDTQTASLNVNGVDENTYSFEWFDENENLVSEDIIFNTNQPGEYELLITNTLNGCTNSTSVVVITNVDLPVAEIPAVDPLNCQIEEVELSIDADPNSNYDYQWTDALGNPISTDLSIIVDEPGEYTLITTNPVTGCQSESSILVEENINMPQAIIDDLSPLGLSCTQSSILLDGNGSLPVGDISFEWFDENGNLVSEEPTYEATSPGTYTLLITDNNTMCVNNVNTIVSQDDELPQVVINPPDLLTCNINSVVIDASQTELDSEFTYTWTTPTGVVGFDDTNILNPTTSTPGTYTLTVVNSLTGCQNEFSMEVLSNFSEPIAQANAEDILDCVTTEVRINSDGSSQGNNFQNSWIIDGVTLSDFDFVTVQNPGTYTLIVTDLENGCTSESLIVVEEDPNQPTAANIVANDITCFGFEDGFFQVNEIEGGTAPYIFNVDGEDFSDLPNIDNLGPGSYPITVTDAIGCTFETQVTIVEPPQVFVNLGEDITINLGESAFLSASSNVDQITWTSVDSLDCVQNCFIQEVSPFNTTVYEVEVIDENGCTDIDEIVVRVDTDLAVYIPNAFSPNDDGINDFFRVFGNSSVLRVQNMLIADKWGEIVYEEDDILLSEETKFWDGKHRGEVLNNNVLVYYVVVEFIDGRTEAFKGDVTLVR